MAATAARTAIDLPSAPWDGWLTICIPAAAHSLEGFRAWAQSADFPQRGSVSFINGEILIDMSPEEIETHNKVKTEVTSVLHRLSRELNLGVFYSDRTLITNVAANLSTEPDGMFVSWDSLRSGRLKRAPRKDHPGESVELEGAPDMVLEIVSRSSIKKDTEKQREAYCRAGIPEYWLINALGKQVDFQILIRRGAEYVPSRSRQGWRRSSVFAQDFRLRRGRDPIGDWQYSLESKAVLRTGEE